MKYIGLVYLRNVTLHGQFLLFHRIMRKEDLVQPSAFLENLCSSEPRDYVYALKAILPNTLKPIKVDYEAPIGQVYAEATKAVILHRQSLEILQYASIETEIPGLPSWAANWGLQEKAIRRPRQYDNDWRRNKDKSCVDFSLDNSIMKLRGLRVLKFSDCLSDVLPLTDSTTVSLLGLHANQDSVETRHGIISRGFLHRIYREERHMTGPGTGESIIDKLLYLVVSNNDSFSSSRVKTQVAEKWLRVLINGDTSQKFDFHDADAVRERLGLVPWRTFAEFANGNSELKGFLQACEHKKVFMAEGKLGLCWANTRVGDTLVRVQDHGAYQKLLVLRPHGNQFTFIGHTMLAQEKLEDWNESDVEWFEIA